MLAFPRLYGYVFNPISIYFIYHYDNTIEYILYEVKNTFKEQHGYLMPVDTAPSSDEAIHQRTSKMLHVSPFIHMDCHYHFRIRSPLDDFQISIHQFDNDNKILTAYWDGKKRALNDLNIIKTVLSHPFMTYKVTAAIHWQALRLWLKGLRYIPKPKRKNEDIS